MNPSDGKLAAGSVRSATAPRRLAVLGAGLPFVGRAPSALRVVDRDRKVLDWVLHAFARTATDVTFIGGYDVRDIAASYPDIRIVINADWRQTGATGSLLSMPSVGEGELYICYSDIVFHPELVNRFAGQTQDCVVVAVDRHDTRNVAERRRMQRAGREVLAVAGGKVLSGSEGGDVAEFVGLVRLPGYVAAMLPQIVAGNDALRRQHLSGLVEELVRRGIPVVAVDAHGEWADLEDDGALTRFVFGSKAETLDRLDGRLKQALVPKQIRFTAGEWRRDPAGILARLTAGLATDALAIRSSAASEDSFTESNAGRFESVLDVAPQPADIGRAIDRVIGSYGDERDDHQVFVQPMVQDIAWSGVLLTRTPRIGGPYITVAWSESGSAGVTSGQAADQRTYVMHRGHHVVPEAAPAGFAALLAATGEIEGVIESDAIDIEFAVDRLARVHILQVRPLVLQHERTGTTDAQVAGILSDAERALRAADRGALLGHRPLWGVMPDWNPAEIIGVRPGRLACDLYADLICDDVWALQRAEYGYRDLRPCPLLGVFAGHAYVDVRASFNSFVPAGLDDASAAWLVDAYIDRLTTSPELHDKVEFDVALTCWSFDLDKRFQALAKTDPGGVLETLRPALADITRRGIARCAADHKCAEQFGSNLSALPAHPESLQNALTLLDLCRRQGVRPFAHLARGAFVAMTLLRSAVETGLLRAHRIEAFLRSIRTVSHDFIHDAAAVRAGNLPFDILVERYGHLRPGTYDVTSLRYADQPQVFLRPIVDRAMRADEDPFYWDRGELDGLCAGLGAAGIAVDAGALDDFFRTSIEGRERSKFIFTRALSQALEDMVAWAKGLGLSRSELSHVSLADIRAVAQGVMPDAGEFLRDRARQAEVESRLHSLIELPPLLVRPTDVYGFEHRRTEPNYVTQQAVIAAPVFVDGSAQVDIAGRIVLIPRADPGYDWLFGQSIAGLVTAFGGANSHMAIRAAEFGLPAAIGVGEQRFRLLQAAALLELDCRERRIKALELI